MNEKLKGVSKLSSNKTGTVGIPLSFTQNLKKKQIRGERNKRDKINSMNKILKEALIKEINDLEKNYSKRDIEIIENLLKQVRHFLKGEYFFFQNQNDS